MGGLGSFECMFDSGLPGVADLALLTDAELVDAAGGWARAENAAADALVNQALDAAR